jgi:hypothetical protein
VVCDVVCECGDTIDTVDRFEKHLKDCRIILKYKGGRTDYEQKYKAILGTKQVLHMTATEVINKQQMRLVRRSGNIRYREHNLQMNEQQ